MKVLFSRLEQKLYPKMIRQYNLHVELAQIFVDILWIEIFPVDMKTWK